jgi:hypothetical protein
MGDPFFYFFLYEEREESTIPPLCEPPDYSAVHVGVNTPSL